MTYEILPFSDPPPAPPYPDTKKRVGTRRGVYSFPIPTKSEVLRRFSEKRRNPGMAVPKDFYPF